MPLLFVRLLLFGAPVEAVWAEGGVLEGPGVGEAPPLLCWADDVAAVVGAGPDTTINTFVAGWVVALADCWAAAVCWAGADGVG